MSLSLIAFQPRIEEPSKPKPSSKLFSTNILAGIVKCFCVPGKSIKPQVNGLNFTFTTEGEHFPRGHLFVLIEGYISLEILSEYRIT